MHLILCRGLEIKLPEKAGLEQSWTESRHLPSILQCETGFQVEAVTSTKNKTKHKNNRTCERAWYLQVTTADQLVENR